MLAAALGPDGDTLAITLTNATDAPLRLDTHADTRQLRSLDVAFVQSGVTYAAVSMDRPTSWLPTRDRIRIVALAPGDTFVQRIDLQVHAATLHCGVFDVQVSLSGASFELSGCCSGCCS